ncbi:MAG: hypothetical protein M1269_02545 [Chloroflexi bacterium]|nr:hypothetical protein [Chloroflexota bacterium]
MKVTDRENGDPIPVKEELWEPSAHSVNYARKSGPSWQAEPSLFDDRAVLENKEKHKIKGEQAPGSCTGSGSAHVLIDAAAEFTGLQED